MKKALVILLMFVGTVHANERFSTDANFVTTSTIKWIQVSNVFEACDAESKNRGNGGFARLGAGQKMDGCSFWSRPEAGGPKTNTCTVITGRNTDHETVGHEVRHCFQGSFHQ